MLDVHNRLHPQPASQVMSATSFLKAPLQNTKSCVGYRAESRSVKSQVMTAYSPPRRLASAFCSSFKPPCGSWAGDALALRRGSRLGITSWGPWPPAPALTDMLASGVTCSAGRSACPSAARCFRTSAEAALAVGVSILNAFGSGGGSLTAC